MSLKIQFLILAISVLMVGCGAEDKKNNSGQTFSGQPLTLKVGAPGSGGELNEFGSELEGTTKRGQFSYQATQKGFITITSTVSLGNLTQRDYRWIKQSSSGEQNVLQEGEFGLGILLPIEEGGTYFLELTITGEENALFGAPLINFTAELE